MAIINEKNLKITPFLPHQVNNLQIYQPEEEVKRMEIFMNNLKYIEEFNTRKDRTMTLGLNKFADLVWTINIPFKMKSCESMNGRIVN